MECFFWLPIFVVESWDIFKDFFRTVSVNWRISVKNFLNVGYILFLFICFDNSSFLDGQYTVWGQVVEGIEFVDNIKLGSSSDNGSVDDPDSMIKVTVGSAKKAKKKAAPKKK